MPGVPGTTWRKPGYLDGKARPYSVGYATTAIPLDGTIGDENVCDGRMHLGRLTTSQVAHDHG